MREGISRVISSVSSTLRESPAATPSEPTMSTSTIHPDRPALNRLAATLLVGWLPAQAYAAGETRINGVGYDLPTHVLTIDGASFQDAATTLTPYVEFGGSPVTVLGATTGSLTVQLPDPLPNGEYQVYVERRSSAGQVPHTGSTPAQRATYSLTVGDPASSSADGLADAYRGTFVRTVTYVHGNVVFSSGSSWLCIAAAGCPPSTNPAPPAWALVAKKGAAGATGAAGPQGPTGADGLAGPPGIAGADGAQGPQGVVGPQGPQGTAGAAGATGATGPKGDTGPTGPTGPAGPQGVAGPVGPTGAPGSANAWSLTGNAGTDPRSKAIGTTDAQALKIIVDGQAAMTYVPVVTGGTFGAVNVVAGPNTVSAGASQVTISGGGTAAMPNSVTGSSGTIGGGVENTAAVEATVGGGRTNQATGPDSTIGGGQHNTASGFWATVGGGYNGQALGQESTVAGGSDNVANTGASTVGGGSGNSATGLVSVVAGGGNNHATGGNSAIGGGFGNTASAATSTIAGGGDNVAGGEYAAIGGGTQNSASGSASTVSGGMSNVAENTRATVGGGISNKASGVVATVGGGNTNLASGNGSMVPGGDFNKAQGPLSFAGGHRAVAATSAAGSFVWSDNSSNTDFTITDSNTFNARATGGVYFRTNVSGTNTGVFVGPGGGSWNTVSDRNAKRDFAPVDGRDVLAKLVAMPLTSWSYKTEDETIRHMGPMAQDFRAAYGLGYGDTTINTTDIDGVTVAAIQGLYAELGTRDAQIAQLRAEQAKLLERLEAQDARVREIGTLMERQAQMLEAALDQAPRQSVTAVPVAVR